MTYLEEQITAATKAARGMEKIRMLPGCGLADLKSPFPLNRKPNKPVLVRITPREAREQDALVFPEMRELIEESGVHTIGHYYMIEKGYPKGWLGVTLDGFRILPEHKEVADALRWMYGVYTHHHFAMRAAGIRRGPTSFGYSGFTHNTFGLQLAEESAGRWIWLLRKVYEAFGVSEFLGHAPDEYTEAWRARRRKRKTAILEGVPL